MTEPALDQEPLTAAINHSTNGLLEPGSRAEIVADIFPARITPKPTMLPAGVNKMRAVITDQSLTIAWPGGYQGGKPIVNRLDILLEDGATNTAYLGGEVQGADEVTYTIERGSGCSCGAAALRSWKPFPEVTLVQRSANQVTGTRADRYKRI